MDNGRAWCDLLVTEKGGSLTSPSIFPAPPRVLWEEGRNSKGVNKMSEIGNVQHPPHVRWTFWGVFSYMTPEVEHGREKAATLPSLVLRRNPSRQRGFALVDSDAVCWSCQHGGAIQQHLDMVLQDTLRIL